MAEAPLNDGIPPQTLSTSYLSTKQTPAVTATDSMRWDVRGWPQSDSQNEWQQSHNVASTQGLGSTGKGILIGMLSAFGSAALVAVIIAIVYFFRHTNRGRIFLDRIGRPGEYDDEQQFLREEEEALAEMDDLQRAEYMRAKGTF